jgi:hypothetical protein
MHCSVTGQEQQCDLAPPRPVLPQTLLDEADSKQRAAATIMRQSALLAQVGPGRLGDYGGSGRARTGGTRCTVIHRTVRDCQFSLPAGRYDVPHGGQRHAEFTINAVSQNDVSKCAVAESHCPLSHVP